MSLSRFVQSMMARRSLMQGLATGIAALVAVWFIRSRLNVGERVIIAWDMGLIVFFVSLFFLMCGRRAGDMRHWSMKLEASRRTVLLVVSAAAIAALLTVFREMKLAKLDHGWAQAARITFVIVTVGLSWFFVQTAFALDYAHEYFAPDSAGKDRAGLAFPGGETPDFWDFLHFSVIIGAAAQTADISLTSKTMRRMVTGHSLISFAFNAVILALTINLTAGLL